MLHDTLPAYAYSLAAPQCPIEICPNVPKHAVKTAKSPSSLSSCFTASRWEWERRGRRDGVGGRRDGVGGRRDGRTNDGVLALCRHGTSKGHGRSKGHGTSKGPLARAQEPLLSSTLLFLSSSLVASPLLSSCACACVRVCLRLRVCVYV